MPKGSSNNLFHQILKDKTIMGVKEKTFFFLEGLGTLFWVFGDLAWIFEVEYLFPVIYSMAAVANFAALMYAFLKLRDTLPLLPIVAYNFWVIMGCIWTFADINESNGLLIAAKAFGLAMLLVTVWEFMINKNNKENLISFIKMFRKIKIKEEAIALGIADILALPDDLLRLLRWMMQQEKAGLAEISGFLNQDAAVVRKTLSVLLKLGYLREIESGDKTFYQVRLAPRRSPGVTAGLPESPHNESRGTASPGMHI